MTNIRLSKRLKCIADMVDNESILVDVGCDHALLDIYLSKKRVIKKAIACDITKGALNQAKKNILVSNVKNIETRLGDGLDVIDAKDNVDTIVMSGLGDQKIIGVLNKNTHKLKSVDTIIIQSNTGISKVRKNITLMGYYIEDECLVKEKGIIYTIIKFKKGFKRYTKKELELGPVILKNKNDLFNELLKNMIDKNWYVISKIPNHMFFKKMRLRLANFRLKKEMINEES